jgi:hypothetical protein
LIELGATLPPEEAADTALEEVTQPGVAPEHFYATTIYPTEVRVRGEWVPVQGQRMDAVIVVEDRAGAAVARCKLLRDLRPGEAVVTGVQGIRTVRRTESRSESGESRAGFEFMGAAVSSERRVEPLVDRVAWELRRVRDRAAGSWWCPDRWWSTPAPGRTWPG